MIKFIITWVAITYTYNVSQPVYNSKRDQFESVGQFIKKTDTGKTTFISQCQLDSFLSANNISYYNGSYYTNGIGDFNNHLKVTKVDTIKINK